MTAREVRAQVADEPSAPGGPKRLWRVIDAPETNVAVFAFLLNVPWEFLQMPLFASDPSSAKWEHLRSCTLASLGDAVIAVVSFWGVAATGRTRRWILQPTWRRVALFVAIGVEITVVMEWLATGVLARWAYADDMPVIPGLETGLLPVLQWITLPPLIVWFVRRQLT